eukprot:CAMPEP_0206225068 /NCGR_PEP_ID=MMETSP0047_2-20121206/7357_1 /ASSEMBLY_ACC=CAM_ASM_000192 /TAXON_ID=195065 /ORGANISM="Chroomonas mesostigmatica_cf, Strain CCMP1168" /LENGTH=363 /DNA_ID=CAMNT_0053648057 /DNA_START=236 /DNA_END=1327 /DNA_ORIENTATION=+
MRRRESARLLLASLVLLAACPGSTIHVRGAMEMLRRNRAGGADGKTSQARPPSPVRTTAEEKSAEAAQKPKAPEGFAAHAAEGLKNMLASGVASAVGKAMLQPFDTIKTVQQNSKTSPVSLLTAASDLISRGGPLALYSGLGATIMGSVPSIAVYFGVYQFLKGQLTGVVGLQWGIALSAGMANLLAAFVRVPFEIVKQRLQAGLYADTMAAVSGMYADGGVGAFFHSHGMMGQVMRDIPYAIVTLLAYEAMQRAVARRAGQEGGEGGKKKAKGPVLVSLVTGALAGGLGTLVTNPLDVVKTRLMVSPHLYTGYWGAVATTFSQEGAGAFMRGVVPRLIHKMPANSVFFVVYEAMRRLLGVQR